jgi:hypothetical protein
MEKMTIRLLDFFKNVLDEFAFIIGLDWLLMSSFRSNRIRKTSKFGLEFLI